MLSLSKQVAFLHVQTVHGVQANTFTCNLRGSREILVK